MLLRAQVNELNVAETHCTLYSDGLVDSEQCQALKHSGDCHAGGSALGQSPFFKVKVAGRVISADLLQKNFSCINVRSMAWSTCMTC